MELNYWRLNRVKTKQKYQLSKVVQVLEKVLYEKDKDIFLSAKIDFILLQIIAITIQRFTNMF